MVKQEFIGIGNKGKPSFFDQDRTSQLLPFENLNPVIIIFFSARSTENLLDFLPLHSLLLSDLTIVSDLHIFFKQVLSLEKSQLSNGHIPFVHKACRHIIELAFHEDLKLSPISQQAQHDLLSVQIDLLQFFRFPGAASSAQT